MNSQQALALQERNAALEKGLAAKNRELEIEAALESVRTVAMGMKQPVDMLDVCRVISTQLELLKIRNIRNIQTAIFYEIKGVYLNYEYFNLHDKTVITEVEYNLQPDIKAFVNQMQQDSEAFFTTSFEDAKLKEWIDYQQKANQFVDPKLNEANALYYYFYSIGPGALGISTYAPLNDDDLAVFKRFRNVFELAYRRFMDIQEAEAQAREAQIELGLEKVRTRAMAMQQSGELAELVDTVFKELTKLHFTLDRCIIIIIDENSKSAKFWMANPEVEKTPSAYHVKLNELPYFTAIYNAWKERRPKWVYDLKGPEKSSTVEYLFAQTEFRLLPEKAKQGMKDTERIFLNASFNNFGSLQADTLQPLPEANLEILNRFGKVFDITYTRFNDLQKAEAQAREAKIELALERVRARTMSMQHSQELQEAADLLFQQVLALGVPAWSCGYNIWEKEEKVCTGWMNSKRPGQPPFKIPLTENPTFIRFYDSRQKGELFYVEEKSGELLKADYKYMLSIPVLGEQMNEFLKAGFTFPTFQINHVINFSHGNLIFITYQPVPESWDIFKRFAKVFEQTYTRFLDLQKAEAQAREARIEVALEKIRSRSLGMHLSIEIKDVVSILFEKLKELNLVFDGGAAIHLFNEVSKNAIIWVASPDLPEPSCVNLPYDENAFENNPIIVDVWNAKETSKHIYNKFYSFEEKNKYFDYVFKHNDFITIPEPTREFILQADSYTASFIAEKNSLLGANSWTRQLFSDNDLEVLKRIARVFEQAYIRFLDLQKAEAQAREAKIEAALERVRARAMAMNNSNELSELVAILFEELVKLNLVLARCIIWIFDHDTLGARVWMANSEDKKAAESYYIKRLDHPYYEAIIKGWKEQNPKWVYDLQGSEKRAIDELLLNETELSHLPETVKAGLLSAEHTIVSGSFNNFGLIEASGPAAHSEEQLEILSRFGKVFDLTYTRFNDLKQAEAQAREAIKRSSVDRVRAEIASMRTTSDLERITPLIWNELTTLGVPFIRCGVFIMDEAQQQVQIHLSTPDGKAIAAFRLPYYATKQVTQIAAHWQQKKIFKDHMDEAAFIEYTKNLVLQGAVSSGEKYLTENRPTNLYLHFLPFLQGMLYAGNTAPLSDDELHLVQNLADAFSTAYARYDDFSKLESAKVQIEKTLVDLKQAQAQLIQSEKMASLGELTAGIAHEIQNPLNFVNNFSDVNKEMIAEMKEEIDKGNYDEVKLIANDIEENEEKINHHGKRADAIVKGMLQHSRSSSGIKEPTDINKLADEYLRLSYHGLRAKDKSFNAEMKTDFDNSIGKINVIPQDIGRVLLNVYNNAFYAVNDRKKLTIDGYEPTVSVSTKKNNDKIKIVVHDNGNGIPKNIIDKIFQPFFTTKPTGQGTGLGLSLAYDIIKSHGGEIKMETKEGEGSEFVIILPKT